MKTAILSFALLMSAGIASAQSGPYQDVTFDPNLRYSQLLIESRLTDFYANKKQMGLNRFDENGNLIQANAGGSNLKFDYVPGLVAKGIIEAAQYYQHETFARGWYYAVEDYANRFASSVPTSGKSLDDLNATKMYATLYDITSDSQSPLAQIANAQTRSNASEAMRRAAEGLKDCDKNYSIKASVAPEAAGGWYHKSSYPNQMWLDGQYMGPALLAQLIDHGYGMKTTAEDWQTIMLQFDLTWRYLWNEETQLLYHAFSADPTGSYAKTWADPVTWHSQEYWGRACGWYFLALVDVLEVMPESADRERLQGYLQKLADGLAARQDAATGCWYQLLGHDGTFMANRYNGKSYPDTYNYLESSATCIFAASYLKAIRLGLLSAEKYGPVAGKAYRGAVTQFVKRCNDGSYTLTNCCASAGLGGSNYRDGSAAYYLLGSDVTRVTTYTEGKVFGSFILASVEYERAQKSWIALDK